MSFPRYDKYKDSGVEWLGEVPSHWEHKRLRFIVSINPSKAEVAYLSPDTEVSFLPMEAIGEKGELDLSRTRPLGEVLNGYSYFADNDLVFAKVTPCFENGKGAIISGLVGRFGFGTTELTVLRPNDTDDRHFIWWLLNSRPFREPGVAEMLGAGGLKRVPDSYVADFRAPWPIRQDRAAIAAFLDRETAKIDALVAEQEKLIALLKEKRQAVISHAVTKGLDPTAPMKDSGIEWLGEVPAHWDVLRVKHLIHSLEQGWSPQCESYPAETDDEWGVLKVGCVNGGVFDPSENKALPAEIAPMPELGVLADDLLVSRANTRDLVGSAAVVTKDRPRLMLCDKLYRLQVLQSKCLPRFLSKCLGTEASREHIELAANGASSSMVNIGQDTILDLPAPTPPIEEQTAIVAFLDKVLSKFDALTAEAQRAIDLLKERRSALISAAVTGKIDVRGLASAEAA